MYVYHISPTFTCFSHESKLELELELTLTHSMRS